MKRLLLLASLALLTTAALAATGSSLITFTRPSTWSDGSPLAATDITGYQVDCTFTPTGGAATACATANLPGGSVSSGTVTITYPVAGGVACFRLKTLTALVPGDGFSTSQACRTFARVTPNNPTDLTVTVTVTVTVTP